jgi:hypothetical protein
MGTTEFTLTLHNMIGCLHSLFVAFVWFSEQTAILSIQLIFMGVILTSFAVSGKHKLILKTFRYYYYFYYLFKLQMGFYPVAVVLQ